MEILVFYYRMTNIIESSAIFHPSSVTKVMTQEQFKSGIYDPVFLLAVPPSACYTLFGFIQPNASIAGLIRLGENFPVASEKPFCLVLSFVTFLI